MNTKTSPEMLLEVRDLRVRFATAKGTAAAVDGASFDVRRREVLGIVGESGSGKSVTLRSILRLSAMKFLPFAIRTPHSGVGGCAPNPRYPKLEPRRITRAISVIQ